MSDQQPTLGGHQTLTEQVENLFDLRVSGSGADITIRLGGQKMTVDYEAWMELRNAIQDLIKQRELEARIEEWRTIGDYLTEADKLAMSKSFMSLYRIHGEELIQQLTNLKKGQQP